MKIAIIHDYIKEYGGAERVLEALIDVFPEAEIFTSVYLPSYLGPHKDRFKKFKVQTSFLQYLPFKAKLISPLRLVASQAFKSYDFSGFDVIIVSQTGAYFPNMIKKKNAIQICYCHTPPRYLYGFATARDWKKNAFFRVLGEVANHFLRIEDVSSSQNVDYFIANSENVKRRIEKFYRREAAVIYPPVATKSVEIDLKSSKNKSFFLAGGRLARPKHIDLIVKTFTNLNLPLKIFGKAFAGYGDELRSLAGNNIEFLGEVTDEQKFELMMNSEAFVFASEDEDFGITPVEAMAVGTPVIAYRSGGVLETVIENKTGLFFDQLTEDSLIKAVKKFAKTKFKKEECLKQAEKFSEERFKREIKKFVLSIKNKNI